VDDAGVTDDPRPRSASVVSVAMFAVALLSVVVGLLATAVSGCCGSSDTSSDPVPLLAGLGVAAALGVAAFGLWSGSLSRLVLLACTAALPIVCAIASASSSDLAALLPFTVVGWALLWWYLRRPRVARWLRR
jgi:hypothetical protein